ncbi:MAG: phosphonate C-P lyase system protein PhnH [Cyanobacteria bacterium P01_A01_bin.123]
MITQLPGFKDPVHDAQQTFRALLDALARPGISQATASLTPPQGLIPGCAAACLTLLDLETAVWLQPGLSEAVHSWLLFHTGCRLTTDPQTADFALIWDIATAPSLDQFHQGTPEYPETSTSLLMQLPALHGGISIALQGPGILNAMRLDLPLTVDFWQQWQEMTVGYPLGIDGWCFAENQVLGLPRTACLSHTAQEILP